MKPHKHAELIKAWADGAVIQYKDGLGEWNDCTPKPAWDPCAEYRIKPKTLRFRLALVNGSAPYVLAIHESANLDYYQHVKWLGDWQEVEI